MQIIQTADHPHNKDEHARIVWENRATLDAVYQVRAGFIATIGRVGAYDETFATKDTAVDAITSFRARVNVSPMF